MRKFTYEFKSSIIEGMIIVAILGILFLLFTSCKTPAGPLETWIEKPVVVSYYFTKTEVKYGEKTSLVYRVNDAYLLEIRSDWSKRQVVVSQGTGSYDITATISGSVDIIGGEMEYESFTLKATNKGGETMAVINLHVVQK